MPWIEPLVNMLTTVGHHTFYIPREGCPLSGREIDKLLSQNRISHSRVGMFVDVEGDINLNVPKSQAMLAQGLFDRYGVEVSNPYQRKLEARRPKGWREWGRAQRDRMPRTRSARETRDPFSIFNDVFERR